MTDTPIRLGDLYILDWTPGRGSEQTGARPALVVQNNAYNDNERYPNTVVVAVSKSGRPIPTHVEITRSPENGLWADSSYIKCEQLFTVSKERLGRRLGHLTDDQLGQVAKALRRVLNLL